MRHCRGERRGSRAQAAGPKRKWGPALLPAPTAPSEGSAGPREIRPRGQFSQSPSSPAQASLSIVPLPRERSLAFTRLRFPKARLSFNHFRLTRRSKPSDVPRPFLGRSLLRSALLFRSKASEPRRARGKINSSGASSRLAPSCSEGASHCLSAEIGPSVACRFLLSLAGLPVEAGTSVPITLEQFT